MLLRTKQYLADPEYNGWFLFFPKTVAHRTFPSGLPAGPICPGCSVCWLTLTVASHVSCLRHGQERPRKILCPKTTESTWPVSSPFSRATICMMLLPIFANGWMESSHWPLYWMFRGHSVCKTMAFYQQNTSVMHQFHCQSVSPFPTNAVFEVFLCPWKGWTSFGWIGRSTQFRATTKQSQAGQGILFWWS